MDKYTHKDTDRQEKTYKDKHIKGDIYKQKKYIQINIYIDKYIYREWEIFIWRDIYMGKKNTYRQTYKRGYTQVGKIYIEGYIYKELYIWTRTNI